MRDAALSTLDHFPAAHTFIETGYGYGQTIERAADEREPYERIVAIEIDPGFVERGTARWADDPRVEIWCGDSGVLLKEAIEPRHPTVFWLDAHFSGLDSPDPSFDPARLQCPLVGELRAIRAADWEVEPIVYVDDGLLFVSAYWDRNEEALRGRGFIRSQWPTIGTITSLGFNVQLWSSAEGDPRLALTRI